jgi:hypothetical protein
VVYKKAQRDRSAIFYQALGLGLWEEAFLALETSKGLDRSSRATVSGEIYMLARTGQLEEAAALKDQLMPDDPYQELLEEIIW